MSTVGTNRTNRGGLMRCTFIGVDQTWLAGGQTDANDPSVWTGRALQAECE